METQTSTQQSKQSRRYSGLDAVFIGGRWREGGSGKRAADHNPWTGETLLESSLANASDVDEAYQAAVPAQREWWALPPQERRRVLQRAIELMDQRQEEIVDWIVREAGGTQAKARQEWQLAKSITQEASTFPFRMSGEILAASVPHMESRVYRYPVGVVTVISPFNFPWHLSMRSVAPALACGNTVVLKPASDTPVTGGTLIGKLFEEAGIPKGVLQVIVGAGSDIGDAIVDHPVPRLLSFTGSTRVGRHLGEIAGRRIMKASLELGGNAPMVIFDDADLDNAVDAAIFGTFSHQGQICMATNRLLVQRRIYDAFVERFVARARTLGVGDPDDPETMIGPIINQRQVDEILDRVERTRKAGAQVALEGRTQGLVIPPIVLVGVTNDMPCAREENFGPVAPILGFGSDEEGLAMANDTEAGLSAAVFSSDRARAERAATRIEAGMVHINNASVNDEPNTAFGGVKQSGLGRFGGRWALDEFTEAKWISVMLQPRQFAGVGGP